MPIGVEGAGCHFRGLGIGGEGAAQALELSFLVAEEIKKDPKRFAKVTALAKKKMMDMAAVATDDKD